MEHRGCEEAPCCCFDQRNWAQMCAGGRNMHAIDNMRRYLELESMDKKKTEYDTSQWTQYLPGVCRLCPCCHVTGRTRGVVVIFDVMRGGLTAIVPYTEQGASAGQRERLRSIPVPVRRLHVARSSVRLHMQRHALLQACNYIPGLDQPPAYVKYTLIQTARHFSNVCAFLPNHCCKKVFMPEYHCI